MRRGSEAEQFGEPRLDRGEVVGKARAAAVGDDSIGAAVQWMLGHASVAAIAQQMWSECSHDDKEAPGERSCELLLSLIHI